MNASERYFPGEPVGDLIGRSVPRIESREKVTGAALYTDDLTRPGMLYGAVLGSPYAHARIISYDVSAARAVPGVKAVVTGADLDVHYTGTYLKDQLVLARDKVRYLGEPVAAVAAVDAETAREAARLVEVEYEELEAVFDPEAALAPDAPVIHEHRDRYPSIYPLPQPANATSLTSYREGDPDAAWAECDVIVEGEYRVPAQEHMYLEPVSTIAEVDANGRLTVWSSMQGVARVQVLLAEALGLPMSRVRVLGPRVGGAFGGKCELTNQAVAAALAIAARAPVKMTLARDEDMMTMKRRHGGVIRMKTGAKRDGTLVARRAEIILDGGAYADESPGVAAFAAFFCRGPYRIPHVAVQSWAVYTNKVRGGAFRGFGNPQVTFASEVQLDELAERLGMDPIDLRLKNALESGDAWLGGKPVEVGSLRACLERVREAARWDERRSAPRGTLERRRGVGVAAVAHICGFLSAGATVRLNEDGSVTVSTGAQDIGEGADTALAQIAAGTLGLPLERVSYAPQDSDVSPYNFQTAGSRTTYTVGTAVHQAALRVVEQLFRHAGEMLECAEEDLELRAGGRVGIKGVPEAELPFAAIAGRALFAAGGPISGAHDWRYDGVAFDPKRCAIEGFDIAAAVGVFTFGAQVAEVEVDEATGQIRVIEHWAAHDVGRAINPALVEGQIHGGVVQGLGYGLVEELVWEDGRLVNPSMMDYKILGMADVPRAIHALIVEQPEASGPFGAKGVAENAIIAPAPAVVNAVAHATGARLRQIPATPERVLAALDARAG